MKPPEGSWKIVRDRQPEFSRRHGVSGQWRTSPDPVAALRKKIGEEYGEHAEHHAVGELYDLRDVVDRLLDLVDPDGGAAMAHEAKVSAMGGFTDLIEWCPIPAGGPE